MILASCFSFLGLVPSHAEEVAAVDGAQPLEPPWGAYAVSCPEGFGDLRNPQFFEVFGSWQNRYGRDNLRLSEYFIDVYEQKIVPALEEALAQCPAYVLEVMMNAVLAIETRRGVDAARLWLLSIYDLRARASAVASDINRQRLATLESEWADDIAAVYPKFLGLQCFGPLHGAAAVADAGPCNSSSSNGHWRLPPVQSGTGVLGDDYCAGQRVFVYELEHRYYTPGTFSCLQGQWGTEVLLRTYFQHNCNTHDPDLADWFYVPLYATCMYLKLNEDVSDENAVAHGMDHASDVAIWGPVLDFLRQSRHYHRKQGADHIFLFADGQGPRIWDSYDVFRSESVFMSPESKCPTWGEPVRRYLDVKPCLSSWKDIVIPGHTDYARIQYMRKQDRPSEERRLLMTFHGRHPGAHDAYGDCVVRGHIMELAKHGRHVDVGGFVQDYPERKGDSHFCLVPAGTSPWTNHLYESFYAGCIPVILSDEYEVAFRDELDWHLFSIKWPEAEVDDSLYEFLMELVEHFPQRVASMRAQLRGHACWFNWYSDDAGCNPYVLIQRRLGRLASLRASRPRFWNYGSASGSEPSGRSAADGVDFAHLRRPTRFKHTADEGVSPCAQLGARLAQQRPAGESSTCPPEFQASRWPSAPLRLPSAPA